MADDLYSRLIKLYTETTRLNPTAVFSVLAQQGLITQDQHRQLLEADAANQQNMPQRPEPVANPGIFISYRREDTKWLTYRLHDHLRADFDAVPIFLDLEIEPGIDFTQAIRDAVSQCAVLLAIIGLRWLTITDQKGRRRLDNPNDFVRFEIATALSRGIRVIPVVVDGAPIPQPYELPPDLVDLSKRQVLEIDDKRFRHDVGVLIRVINTLVNRE